jgi:hypothetical protein
LWNNDKGKDGVNPSMTFDSSTGKANLSNWDENKFRPGDGTWVNYDFGFLNDDGTITDANHADLPGDPMEIYTKSISDWEKMYEDFNTMVWCTQCQKSLTQ